MRIIRRPKLWRVVLGCAVLLLCLKLFTTGAAAYRAYESLRTLRDLLRTPDSAPSAQLTDAVRAAASGVGGLSAELRPFNGIARLLLGGDGCVAATGIDLAYALAPYGERAAPLIGALPDLLRSATPTGFEVRALQQHWPTLTADEAAALTALRQRAAACQGMTERTDALYDALYAGLVVLDEALRLPLASMLADDSLWLIVLNNTDEVRGTGGFTTAVMALRVSDGLLTWQLLNSYDVDNPDRLEVHPRPPRPMIQFMALPRLTFRDANWSPDHATAAQSALSLYQLDQPGQQPDGLITVNMSAVATVIAALPPTQLGDQPLTPAAGLDLLRSAWNTDARQLNSDAADRKDFILEAAATLGASFASLSPLQLASAGAALEPLIARRDIMAYAVDLQLQNHFAARDLAGQVRIADGDFLMAVDANLGYNKVSALVTRTLDYRIDLSADPPSAEATLRWHNQSDNLVSCDRIHRGWQAVPTADSPTLSYADRMNGCYWVYARLFTPGQARARDFVSADIPAGQFIFSPAPHPGTLDAWQEGAAHGFGTMLVVLPGAEGAFTMRYVLPEVVRTMDGQSVYTLTMQRQAGAPDLAYSAAVTLPANVVVSSVTPLPDAISGSQVRFSGSLTRDIVLTLIFDQE